jgi:hypothetical protein
MGGVSLFFSQQQYFSWSVLEQVTVLGQLIAQLYLYFFSTAVIIYRCLPYLVICPL